MVLSGFQRVGIKNPSMEIITSLVGHIGDICRLLFDDFARFICGAAIAIVCNINGTANVVDIVNA